MAKMTKKQESQFNVLLGLLHEMITVKHRNNRNDFDEVVSKIRETVKENEDD